MVERCPWSLHVLCSWAKHFTLTLQVQKMSDDDKDNIYVYSVANWKVFDLITNLHCKSPYGTVFDIACNPAAINSRLT